MLNELETLVTPDTLLRWYRELIASKWNYRHRRGPGRPRVMTAITDLVVRMAVDNPSWGYTRIRGAHTRWSTFLQAHWECLTATDFLSVEVCTIKGLENRLLRPSGAIVGLRASVKRRERLGGMLSYYHRGAA